MKSFLNTLRWSTWLGWQIESNWADPLTFTVYSLLRPIGTALILAGMYWAVARHGASREAFVAFYVANAFHEYVVRVLIGMGWVIVEEREEYETLRYVYAAPIGMLAYLTGRSLVKFGLATVSAVLVLGLGIAVLGVRWDPSRIQPLGFLATFGIGLVATLFLGYVVAGAALLLPRAAINLNEGVGIGLFLVCGVIFPIDLLPRGLREVALALPFTYWYEALRRFLLGHTASRLFADWSGPALLGTLAATTAVFAALSLWAFRVLEHRARSLGRLDHSTLF